MVIADLEPHEAPCISIYDAMKSEDSSPKPGIGARLHSCSKHQNMRQGHWALRLALQSMQEDDRKALPLLFQLVGNDENHFHGGWLSILAGGAELPLLQRAQDEGGIPEATWKGDGERFQTASLIQKPVNHQCVGI